MPDLKTETALPEGQTPGGAAGLGRQAAKGALWSMANNWGRQIISLLVMLVLARLLTPHDFGSFAVIVVLVAFAQAILDDGLGEALIQRPALEDDHLDGVFWLNLGLSLLLAGIGAAAAPAIQRAYDTPELAQLIWVGAAALVVGSTGAVHQALLFRRMAFRAIAVRTLAGIVAGGITGIALAVAGAGVWALVGQFTVERLVGTLMLWRAVAWRPRLRFSRPHVAELLPFTAKTAGTRLLMFAYSQADKLLVGLLASPMVLGFYVLAQRIQETVITLLSRTTTQVAFPLFSRVQHERERLAGAFLTLTEAVLAVAAVLLLGLSAVAPALVELAFGSDWRTAGEVLRWLALGGIPTIIGSMSGTVLRGVGHAGRFMLLIGLGAACNLLLIALLIDRGLVALAAALVVRQCCFVPLDLLALRQAIGVPPLQVMRRLAPVLLASAAFVAAWQTVAGLHLPLPHRLLAEPLGAAAGVLAYALVLLTVGRRSLRTCLDLVGLALGRPRATAAGPVVSAPAGD